MAGKRVRNAPGANWKDTYGGLMTILVVFLALMLSISLRDSAKEKAFLENPPDTPGTVMPTKPDVQGVQDAQETPTSIDLVEVLFDEFYRSAIEYRQEQGLESLLMIEQAEDTVTFRFMDGALFDFGETELRPEALEVFRELFLIIERNTPLIREIRVEGHTDNVPVNSQRFRDNWDLSAIRASTVVRMLEAETAVESKKLSASGYGEQRPIGANDTEEGRARNRRVDVVITRREANPSEIITISQEDGAEGTAQRPPGERISE